MDSTLDDSEELFPLQIQVITNTKEQGVVRALKRCVMLVPGILQQMYNGTVRIVTSINLTARIIRTDVYLNKSNMNQENKRFNQNT
jgi:hypothetical protein